MNSLRKHLNSFKYALSGIRLAFYHERNMRIHVAAAVAVLLVNYMLKVSQTEWLITLMLIGLVWMAEIFNTAIERLADRITKEHDPLIGQVKDMAAGAVTIICILAVVCAVIIYSPYIF